MMPTSGGRGPQQSSGGPSQLSPPVPSDVDGPLNLSKPKGHQGGRNNNMMSKMNGNDTRSPPMSQNNLGSGGGDAGPGRGQQQIQQQVPPGLVLPSTFMPFATFPMSSGKLNKYKNVTIMEVQFKLFGIFLQAMQERTSSHFLFHRHFHKTR